MDSISQVFAVEAPDQRVAVDLVGVVPQDLPWQLEPHDERLVAEVLADLEALAAPLDSGSEGEGLVGCKA